MHLSPSLSPPKVLALPGFVWKQLTGEEVSWSKDFPAVDSMLVSLLETWLSLGAQVSLLSILAWLMRQDTKIAAQLS